MRDSFNCETESKKKRRRNKIIRNKNRIEKLRKGFRSKEDSMKKERQKKNKRKK